MPEDQGTIILEAGWAEDARVVKADPVTLEHEVISGDQQAHVPDINADGTKLVWAGPSDTDPTWPDIYLRDLPNGDIRRVSSGGGPKWTFDQKALLVSRKDGVYRMELDGSAKLVRTGEDLSGTEIAKGTYVFGDAKTLKIVDGDEETLVFDGGDNCGPNAWDLSSDGRSLAFTIGCLEADDSESGLYVYDLRTGETRPVYDGDVNGAAWSPDGRSIATTFRPDREVKQSELWIVDAQTGGKKVLRSDGWSAWPIWVATA
jgi:Tol biopolymer transport system component